MLYHDSELSSSAACWTSNRQRSRKRSRSIGEELFLTHLKRAVGLDPDYDTDPEVSASSTSDPKGKGANEKNSVEKKTPTDVKTDDNTMRLRDGRIIQHKSQ